MGIYCSCLMLVQEAVRGGFAEICQLLSDNGAKLFEEGNLVSLADSSVASVVNLRRIADVEFGIEAEWEIKASELTVLNKLGEGEFGEVFKAKYHGTFVAVKQLKSSDQIALGDFRTEMSTLRKLHHPNAVQFLGACTRKQPYLIVTELMSCSLSTAFNLMFSLTLRRQVRSCHPTDLARACTVFGTRFLALGCQVCQQWSKYKARLQAFDAHFSMCSIYKAQ